MMNHHYAPVVLEALLYTYYCPQPHPKAYVSAVFTALKTLEADGLIEKDEDSDEPGAYCVTERGRAHVQQLCALPLPEKMSIWVDAHGKPITKDPL